MCANMIFILLIYMLNAFGVITYTWSSPIIDGALLFQSIFPLPVLFWFTFVTYAKNSVILKYLIEKIKKEKEIETRKSTIQNQLKN